MIGATRHLKFYTSLWAMMPHDQSGVILPFDQICEMVASAGYDGMAIDLGAGDVEQAHAIRPNRVCLFYVSCTKVNGHAIITS